MEIGIPEGTSVHSKYLWLIAGLMAPVVAAVPHPAVAQGGIETGFDIPAGDLSAALRTFGRTSGTNISYDEATVRGKRSEAVKGNYAPAEAIALLLKGTGLEVRGDGAGGFVLAKAQSARDVGEVVVTRNRTAEQVGVGVLGSQQVLNTPLSVTGYTAAMIQDQGARSASEVLANDPSVRLQGAGDGNYDFFSIRGFTITASAFSMNGLYAVLPWNTLSPEWVEQFEIIRGPSATITGSSPFGAIGGAVNLQPKRAQDDPITRLTTSVDFGGQVGGHADVGRRFGPNGQWGVRVNLAYRDGGLARDHQSEETLVAAIGADYRGDRFRFSVDAGHQYMRVDGASFLFYIYEGTDVPAPPKVGRNVSPDWAFSRSKDYYIAGRAEFDVTDDIMLYAAAGTRDHASAILNPYSEIANGAGDLDVYPYHEPYFAHTKFSGEAGLRARFDTGPLNHKVVLSGSIVDFTNGWTDTFYDGYASNLYDPFYPPSPDLTGVPKHADLQLKNRLTGFSIIDTISLAQERYQLTLGLRRQQFVVDRPEEPDNRYDKAAWAPSVGALVKLDERVSVYANFMTGLSQGPNAPVGTENFGEIFPPSKTEQYEAGVKAQFGGFFTSLSLFQISQPAEIIDPVTNIFSVDGEQRHRGIEWTMAGTVVPGLRLLGGANYLSAKLTRTEGGLLDGQRAPGVPRFTANLGGEWDLPFLNGLTVTSRVIYTSGQFLYADNAHAIDDWLRWDAGARYAAVLWGTPVTLRLNVINVTGKDYWASAKGFGLTLGAPRSALFSLTVDL